MNFGSVSYYFHWIGPEEVAYVSEPLYFGTPLPTNPLILVGPADLDMYEDIWGMFKFNTARSSRYAGR